MEQYLEEVETNGRNAKPRMQRHQVGQGIQFAGRIPVQIYHGNAIKAINQASFADHASPKPPSGQ